MTVTVIGSINVDIIARVTALPRPGETVMADATLRMPGGKGANQAAAAARMGARVTMAAAVGDDADGRWMIDALSGAGVAIDGVSHLSGAPTGAAYIAVDAGGENQIIVAPGANAAFAPAMVPPVPEGAILLAQMEVPPATIAAAFARPARLRILNAAPAVADAAGLFDAADILIVNEHELAIFAARGPVEGIAEAVEAARGLIRRDDQAVIVTLGGDGAVAVWRDRHRRAPALPVDPVDTVGAGDCFCGALAALLDEGMAIDQALPLANAAAGLCTLSVGAVPAMPDRAAAEAALRRAAR